MNSSNILNIILIIILVVSCVFNINIIINNIRMKKVYEDELFRFGKLKAEIGYFYGQKEYIENKNIALEKTSNGYKIVKSFWEDLDENFYYEIGKIYNDSKEVNQKHLDELKLLIKRR